MMHLALQRKFVKLLQKHYESSGSCLTREQFLNDILSRKTTRWNYFFVSEEKLKRRFNDALGDCIEGPYQYIGYADAARTSLKVTLEGRDFIGFGGWFQELFKRRDKVAMFLFGGTLGAIVSPITRIFILLKDFFAKVFS